MKLPPTIYVLKIGSVTKLNWRPRLMVPSSQVMAKAIKTEFGKARTYGHEFLKRMAVERFQIQTGKLRMDDSKADELFEIVSKAMEDERLIL